MQQIKISEFTIERIQNREFEKLIPEFYELKEIVENNPWHNNDSVLNHTISLLKELEELIKKPNDKIKVYLDKKINTHSREKLLFLSFSNKGDENKVLIFTFASFGSSVFDL